MYWSSMYCQLFVLHKEGIHSFNTEYDFILCFVRKLYLGTLRHYKGLSVASSNEANSFFGIRKFSLLVVVMFLIFIFLRTACT
jgi:hypothetical protein